MDNRLSENIKKARIEHGYKSQRQFAEDLHVHENSVKYWESGKTIPDLESLILISQLLDVDLDYLTGRIDKPTHDLQFISEKTGLSVDAVKILCHQKQISDTETSTILSRLICHRLFVQLMRNISALSRPRSFLAAVVDHLTKDAPYIDAPEDVRAIYQSSTDRLFNRIVDDISEQREI